jgi:hypothetical protein
MEWRQADPTHKKVQLGYGAYLILLKLPLTRKNTDRGDRI